MGYQWPGAGSRNRSSRFRYFNSIRELNGETYHEVITDQSGAKALTNEGGADCQLIANNAVSSRPILWAYAQHSPCIVNNAPLSRLRNIPRSNWPSGDCWHPCLDKYCNILNINHSSGILIRTLLSPAHCTVAIGSILGAILELFLY